MRGEANPMWHGGSYLRDDGYIQVWLSPTDFFRAMANKNGHILQHRLVMARYIGRCLQPFEKVHHKNGLRNDNRIENLELTTQGAHIAQHSKGYREGYAAGLQDGRDKQIKELRDQIKLLQWQIKEKMEVPR